MDKEYIDKNKILYQMSMGLIPQDYEWTRAYALARKLIKDAPAEDVEPVRHGKWIDTDFYADHDTPIYACSVCYEQVYDKHIKAHKYCLHCGAKMDKEN